MNQEPLIMLVSAKYAADSDAEEFMRNGYRVTLCSSISQAIRDVDTIQPDVIFVLDHFIESNRDSLEIYFSLQQRQQSIPMVIVSSKYYSDSKEVQNLDVVVFYIMQHYNVLEYIYRHIPSSRTKLWYPSNLKPQRLARPAKILIFAEINQATTYKNAFTQYHYVVCDNPKTINDEFIMVSPDAVIIDDTQLTGHRTGINCYFHIRHGLYNATPVILVSANYTDEELEWLDLVHFLPESAPLAIEFIARLFGKHD